VTNYDDDFDAGERIERFVRAGANRLRLSGFRKFILRGNVVDLAVGIVIGAAFTAVVTALVRDFLTPLIGIPLSGASEFAKRSFTIGHSQFLYGDFVNSLISLLLVGLGIYYFVVLPVNHLMERFKPETEPGQQTKVCPECRSSIPFDATRCAFCTVAQPPLHEAEIKV
jgi:large conductance mechanosensitive channel